MRRNKFLRTTAAFLIKKLDQFNNWLYAKDPITIVEGFEDLAPKDDMDGGVYFDALLYALESPKIKNVAITGTYGSGKSSIISSFEKQYPRYKFLNVSLASFAEIGSNRPITGNETKPGDPKPLDKLSNDTESLQSGREQLIELSILQQIFYKVKSSKIPDSRFKRIFSLNRVRVAVRVAIFIIAILSSTIVFNPDFFNRFSWWSNLYNPYEDYFQLISIIALLFISIFLFVYLLRLLNNSKFHKLNLKGELEIEPKEETSILNKYLEEILYFFEVTDINVMVIEDLDRFNNTEIFTKLRELNILINKSDQIRRRKEKVVFIYSVKDDIFKNKESRTKFFDFIIPVIPVINNINSFDKMVDRMRKLVIPIPDKAFLKSIALYIDDMRTLTNIFNEFSIYKNKNIVEVRDEKLLSIILYKNIYPNDFALLQKNGGILFNVFNKKEKLLEYIISNKQNELDNLENRINSVNGIRIKNIYELNSIYINKFSTKIPKLLYIEVDGEKIQLSKLHDDNLFLRVTKSKNLSYLYCNEGPYNSDIRRYHETISFDDIQKDVDAKNTYDQRREQICDSLVLDEIKRESESIKSEIELIKSMHFKDLCKFENALKESHPELYEKRLLLYLVRNGYIDEMYVSLISHFYEELLTTNDYKFLLRVKDSGAPDFGFEIKNFDEILGSTSLYEFEHPSILNFSLLSYIIENIDDTIDQLKLEQCFYTICKQLSNKQDFSKKFIDEYIFSKSNDILIYPKDNITYFIKGLVKNWSSFWEFIVKESQYSEVKKRDYLILIIESAEFNDIITLNINSSLSNYIAKTSNFLSLFNVNYYEKVFEVIKEFGIKFELLDSPAISTHLFNKIYENDNYQINEKMIAIVIQEKTKKITLKELEEANYTSIMKSECIKLINYIDNNLDTYISDVFLSMNRNVNEEELAVISLLNSEAIELANKEKIIEKENVLITDIRKVNDKTTVWPLLAEKKKIAPNWNNVIVYVEAINALDLQLVQFLNDPKIYNEICKTTINSNQEEIAEKILLCLSISETSFQQLIKSIQYQYDDLDFSKLQTRKITLLIENGNLVLTDSNFSRLKNVPDFKNGDYVKLLEKYIDEYKNNIEQYQLDGPGYVRLFQSTKLSANTEQKVALKVQSSDIETSPKLADILTEIFFRDKFNNIAEDILNSIFKHSQHFNNNINLLVQNIDNIGIDNIEDLIMTIGNDLSGLTRDCSNVTIRNTLVGPLLEKLKTRGYISNYKKEKKSFIINGE